MIGFDTVAPNYDVTVERSVPLFDTEIEFFHRNKVHHLSRVARHANLNLATARVLDIGCGTGGADRLLRPMVGSLVGTDVSAEMVARAKSVNIDMHHELYDGETLPFDPESFDLSFAFNVLHHVPPPAWGRFAEQMLTVIRPGGLCVVIEHNSFNPVTRRSVRDCAFDADAVLVRPADLRRVFQGLGAELVARWYILFSPMGGYRLFRAEEKLSWLPRGGQYLYAVRRP